MTASLGPAGLVIQSFDDVLEEIIVAQATALGLTPAQTQRMREGVQSTLGQLVRVEAERETTAQESLLAVYNALSIEAGGAQLDRVVRLLGMTRIPAALSRVLGTAAGTPGTTIAVGTRLQYDPTGTIWEVTVGGVIPGGGSIGITIEREDAGDDEVALDPGTGFDDWTILDSVIGWSDVGSFESTAQPVVGREVELDAALRVRATIEAYRRGSGPIRAIEAAISQVEGVESARVYENRTLITDSDSIPGKAINAVVVGGDDDEIGAAIFVSRSAGAEVYAQPGPAFVAATVTDDYGFLHAMPFNRLTDVDLWIRATLTTSTAEDEQPPNLTTAVAALLLERAPDLFAAGDDVRPFTLSGTIYAQGYSGIDAVLVELSDDGVAWQTLKWPIEIREIAAFDAARIVVIEN